MVEWLNLDGICLIGMRGKGIKYNKEGEGMKGNLIHNLELKKADRDIPDTPISIFEEMRGYGESIQILYNKQDEIIDVINSMKKEVANIKRMLNI